MKRLILASLLASFATGCIITTDGQSEEVGFINTSWNFHKADGTELGCPAGFNTAEVTAVSREFGDAFVDLYSCNARSGSAPYPIGAYEVTIAITNNSGSEEYAHSLTQTLDIVVNDENFSEDFIADGGRVLFDWVLVDAANNDSLDCRTAGNPQSIHVDATSPNAMVSTSLACDDGFGVSNPLPAGTYTATFSALDAAGQPLGEPQTKNVALDDRNDYDDVGTISLPIGEFTPPPN